MTQINPIRNPEGHIEPKHPYRLITAATNPRDKVAVLAKYGMRISEAIQISESNIHFERRQE